MIDYQYDSWGLSKRHINRTVTRLGHNLPYLIVLIQYVLYCPTGMVLPRMG